MFSKTLQKLLENICARVSFLIKLQAVGSCNTSFFLLYNILPEHIQGTAFVTSDITSLYLLIFLPWRPLCQESPKQFFFARYSTWNFLSNCTDFLLCDIYTYIYIYSTFRLPFFSTHYRSTLPHVLWQPQKGKHHKNCMTGFCILLTVIRLGFLKEN